MGYFETQTDEQLVAFRNVIFASALVIIYIGSILFLISFFVGTWPLFVAGGFVSCLSSTFALILLACMSEITLEIRRKGLWYKEDRLNLMRAISKPIIIGSMIVILLLGLTPFHSKSPYFDAFAWLIGLWAVEGIAVWIAIHFATNELRKSSFEMERKFDLRFEDAMKAAEEVVGRLGGSVSRVVRNPLLGRIMRVDFSTPFGGLRIRRMTVKKTMMKIQKSQGWRTMATLLDETAIKFQVKA